MYKKILTSALALLLVFPAAASATPYPWQDQADNSAQLEANINGLLGEHALLTATIAFAVMDGDETVNEEFSLIDSLDQTTHDLHSHLEQAVGSTDAVFFQSTWQSYSDNMIEYALAEQNGQLNDITTAKEMLLFSKTSLNDLFHTIADDSVANSMTLHFNELHEQLMDAIHYYAIGQYTEAYSAVRQAYRQAGRLGMDIGRAADGLTDEGVNRTAADYQLRLANAFGEHVFLTNLVMKNKLEGGKSEDKLLASQIVQQENNDDLSNLIAEVYGMEKASEWEALWKKHTIYMTDFAEALTTDERITEASDGYMQAHQELKDFILDLNPGLNVELVLDVQDGHAYSTAMAAGYFSRGKYHEGYRELRSAYGQAFDTGFTIGKTAVDQYPNRFAESQSSITIDLDTHTLTSGEQDQQLELRMHHQHVFIPLRQLTEILGSSVDYDPDTREITITK